MDGFKKMNFDRALLQIGQDYEQGIYEARFGPVLLKIRPPSSQEGTDGPPLILQEQTIKLLDEVFDNVQIGNDPLGPQVIATTGQSGAGKTSTITGMLQEIIHRSSTSSADGLYDFIQSTLPGITAFTNASTPANANSTRCITQFELTVSRHDVSIQHAAIKIHALEESRVLNKGTCDKFKIFKHLDELISMTKPDYPAESDIVSQRIEKALNQILGRKAFQKVIQRLQAIREILELALPAGDLDGQADQANLETLCSRAAHLLEVTPLQLVMSIAYAPDPDTLAPRAVSESKRELYRNALGTKLYGHLVQNIASKLNSHLAGFCEPTAQDEKTPHRIIKLIDIPGAEDLATNSFEQFTINWINEVVQKEAKEVIDRWENSTSTGHISLSLQTFEDVGYAIEKNARSSTEEFHLALDAISGTERIPRSGSNWSINHYSGDKIYDCSQFITRNKVGLSSYANIVLEESLNGIFGVSATPSASVASRSIVKAHLKIFEAMSTTFLDASHVFVISCVSNINNPKEIEHSSLSRFVGMMSIGAEVSADPVKDDVPSHILFTPVKKVQGIDRSSHDKNFEIHQLKSQLAQAKAELGSVRELAIDLESVNKKLYDETGRLAQQSKEYFQENIDFKVKNRELTNKVAQNGKERKALADKMGTMKEKALSAKDESERLKGEAERLKSQLVASDHDNQKERRTNERYQKTIGELQTDIIKLKDSLFTSQKQAAQFESDSKRLSERVAVLTGSLHESESLEQSGRLSSESEHSRTIRRFISSFCVIGDHKGEQIDAEAVVLQRRIEAFRHPELARQAVSLGVVECCDLNLPGSRALPLIRVIHRLEMSSESAVEANFDASLRWRQIKLKGIKCFQEKLIDNLGESIEVNRDTITAATLVERVTELLMPLIDLPTDVVKGVIKPAIQPTLLKVFSSGGQYSAFSKQDMLSGLNQHGGDLSWLLAGLDH